MSKSPTDPTPTSDLTSSSRKRQCGSLLATNEKDATSVSAIATAIADAKRLGPEASSSPILLETPMSMMDMHLHVGNDIDIHMTLPVGAGSWSGTMATIAFLPRKSDGTSPPCQSEELVQLLLQYWAPQRLVVLGRDEERAWLSKIVARVSPKITTTVYVADQAELTAKIDEHQDSGDISAANAAGGGW